MKKTLFVLIISLFILSASLPGEVVATFPDLLKPTGLVIDDNNIYITENTTIYIYSLKDFKLIKKFGKSGEGPQEFNRFVTITPLKDKLLINSMSKISYYTKNGEYIKEIKTKGGFSFLYQPLGDKYIGRGVSAKDNTRYVSINLYDKDLNKISTLINQEDDNQFGKGVLKILNTTLSYTTFNNKLYLVNGSDFEIKIFDSSAKEVMLIKRDYKKRKFTEEDKQMVFDEIKSSPQQRQFLEAIKKIAVFPKEWPAIASVFERDNVIYVSTFKSKDKTKYEFLLFDANGKFIHSMYIPLKFQTALRPYPMSIKNGKLYQLIENEDEEEWELHESFIHNSKLTKFSEITENINSSSKLKHK